MVAVVVVMVKLAVMMSGPAGSNGYDSCGNADDYDGDCDDVSGW